MRIVTTPMCEEVVRLAGINDYKVNKNPDLEDGDLAILLSESKVEMNSLAIKLNTPSQLFESIKEVSKLKNELSDAEILEFFKNYNLCVKYLENHENSHVKVKVYSNFLKEVKICLRSTSSLKRVENVSRTSRRALFSTTAPKSAAYVCP